MAKINWKSQKQIDAEAAAPKPKGDIEILTEQLVAERFKNMQLQETVDELGKQMVGMRLDFMTVKNRMAGGE